MDDGIGSMPEQDAGALTAIVPATEETAIEAYIDEVWMEMGLSTNTLAAYRADLRACAGWLSLRRCGMTLLQAGASPQHFPARAREVFDVTGAGDTVIAALTLALASGANPVDATLLANAAAGVVVGKIGTATVSQQELQNQLLNITTHQPDIYQEPIP